MHMADALLSPAVGGTMLAVSVGVLACSIRDIRKNFQESRIPLMGVAGAFVFAAQMVNFAIPGTGSSGHIGGAVLLAALLGPSPAFLVMAGVLLIQALFFADGGLLSALGGADAGTGSIFDTQTEDSGESNIFSALTESQPDIYDIFGTKSDDADDEE